MQVFALVRYVEDPQRFSIEYSNGKISRYTATDRYPVARGVVFCLRVLYS